MAKLVIDRHQLWSKMNARAEELLLSHTHWAELSGVSLATISRLNHVDGALDRAFESTLQALEHGLQRREEEVEREYDSERIAN